MRAVPRRVVPIDWYRYNLFPTIQEFFTLWSQKLQIIHFLRDVLFGYKSCTNAMLRTTLCVKLSSSRFHVACQDNKNF